MRSKKCSIYCLIGDADECQVLPALVEGQQYEVSIFSSVQKCLEVLQKKRCQLFLTDQYLSPVADDVSPLQGVCKQLPLMPVIVITEKGDVAAAVRAIKAGVTEVIERPWQGKSLLAMIESILKKTYHPKNQKGKVLTDTEEKILSLILDGNSNSETAAILCCSVRTVEDHRANLMNKLGVRNSVELGKIGAQLINPYNTAVNSDRFIKEPMA